MKIFYEESVSTFLKNHMEFGENMFAALRIAEF